MRSTLGNCVSELSKTTDNELPERAPRAKTAARRFRGFLPVVVDVETAGFNPQTDALLEIAAVLVDVDPQGVWSRVATESFHVVPFAGANLDPEALEFTGIDPYHPFRLAVDERDALNGIFTRVGEFVAEQGCTRAIMVGHNTHFDLAFVKAAAQRAKIKNNPFHAFSTFDTASLAGLAYGQTVLSKAVQAAGLDWDSSRAHSAVYDAEVTAELFCTILNRWSALTSK